MNPKSSPKNNRNTAALSRGSYTGRGAVGAWDQILPNGLKQKYLLKKEQIGDLVRQVFMHWNALFLWPDPPARHQARLRAPTNPVRKNDWFRDFYTFISRCIKYKSENKVFCSMA